LTQNRTIDKKGGPRPVNRFAPGLRLGHKVAKFARINMKLPDDIINTVRQAMELEGEPSRARVVVAMSGGVDSSVAAALIKAAGFETVGITLQLYDHGAAMRRSGACCAGQDIHDARRVAESLGMPHYVLDYESRFKTAVIDEFVTSYMRGETPIPCVNCNQTVKFADLLQMAHELGAAALATGHYVTSRDRGDGSGHRDLYTPKDISRDQSYFLYATTQAQADFLRFPLGALRKQQTRDIAQMLNLSVADKPDSQDICFVPRGRYQDVVVRLRPEAQEQGEIVHVDGRVLGQHNGIINFTVGQRRGLGVAEGEPLYVVRIDAGTRRVVVGPRASLMQSRVPLRAVNWLGEEPLGQAHGRRLFVKIRSTRAPIAARLTVAFGETAVILEEPEAGVPPGQACVFYERPDSGARILGGGIIGKQASFGGTASLPPDRAAIQLENAASVAI
jgi:tRNA-specific 2-thiouridylase